MTDIGLVSHAIAFVSYILLSLLLLRQWKTRVGPTVLISCALTAAWAGTIAAGTLTEYPPIVLMQLAELARDAAWLALLLQLTSLQSSGNPWVHFDRPWRVPGALFLLASAALILSTPALRAAGIAVPQFLNDMQLAFWLLIAVLGLLLTEQLYRNALPVERWSSKFICLAIGGLFAYDFLMYAEALLFRQLDPNLWQARGLISAIAVPWLAVGIVRQRQLNIDLHVSRQVVFHSVTLIAAGVYLLCVSLVGYYLKFTGGDWGGVLQLAFLASGLALLLSLLFSGRLRANLRVQLNKHFFSYRYDYREEWLKFTASLAGLTDDVPGGIIQTMGTLVSSNSGMLFVNHQERMSCLATWQMPEPDTGETLNGVSAWMQETGWVVDVREWHSRPENYQGLDLPEWLAVRDDIWLLVPLVFRECVTGILILRRAELKHDLDWEDRDLLKTAGRQAATLLAQHLSSQALVEAKQFDAFNRLSAYVVHDLKNILAQQSLMLANADRHKNNPAFVDDMLGTVANSVKRMQRLMDQMRSGIRGNDATVLPLAGLLNKLPAADNGQRPELSIESTACDCHIVADGERLLTVFGHLIQNAREATPDDGSVRLVHRCEKDCVRVQIIDTGTGMTSDFVRDRLFRPFDSTKGLTGMGIGAFESREYVRQLGGELSVQSQPGEGSCFTLSLPRESCDDSDDAAALPLATTDSQTP